MAENILARMAVELSARNADFNKGISQSQKLLDGFAKEATSATNLIKGALAGLSVGLLGREIIDVTSEFQKFGAVLTNTLGSRSAANIALRDIENFAKTTPFAVDELTSSFVKLANQGFTPTTDELRKLGDLASSTGKGFDQLAEAIIDAQTGEFERLKEFGIRASKEGDKVRFTFKGVQTQTEFTSKAIREYILSLGDAEGVSGAMSAISETLGGQISNLGDNWTQFLKVIGDGNKGVLSAGVGLLNNLLGAATEFLKTNRQIQEETATNAQSGIVKELKELEQISGDVQASADKLIARLEEERQALVDLSRQYSVNDEEGLEQIEILNRKALVIDAQITAINDYTKAQVASTAAQDEANKKAKESLGLIGGIEKELKSLEEQRKKSFSTAEIAAFNARISDLKENLEVLNASRPLTKFAQELKGFIANGSNQLPEFDLKIAKPEISPDLFPTDAQIEPPDFSAVQYAFAVIQQGYKDTGVLAEQTLSQMTQQIKANGDATISTSESSAKAWELQIQRQQEAANAAVEYGSAVGDALGAAISGQISFADAMKKLTAQLLQTFLARALGGIIASAATSGGPPPVAIALAAAGVAAISAMFAKIGGPSKSVSGGGSLAKSSSSAVQRTERMGFDKSEQIVLVQGEFVARGSDLVLAINKQNKINQRTGG